MPCLEKTLFHAICEDEGIVQTEETLREESSVGDGGVEVFVDVSAEDTLSWS